MNPFQPLLDAGNHWDGNKNRRIDNSPQHKLHDLNICMLFHPLSKSPYFICLVSMGKLQTLLLSLPPSPKMESQVKIFSGTNSQNLSGRIARSYGTEPGKVEVRKFSDGEICPVILESIRGDYVFLVQSTILLADNFLELLMLVDGAGCVSA